MVEVVVAVEGDGSARPVEVLGHRHPNRKDLPTLPLALSRHELRRGPAIGHVTIVNYGEPIIVLVAAPLVPLSFF